MKGTENMRHSDIPVTDQHQAPFDIKELQDALYRREADVLRLKKEGAR
jgi:hypothetical protein